MCEPPSIASPATKGKRVHTLDQLDERIGETLVSGAKADTIVQ
jgi:hypothetical protein